MSGLKTKNGCEILYFKKFCKLKYKYPFCQTQFTYDMTNDYIGKIENKNWRRIKVINI